MADAEKLAEIITLRAIALKLFGVIGAAFAL